MNLEPEALYIKDNKGAIRVWQIGVLDWRIIMEYGLLDGALQTKIEDVFSGKAGRTRTQQVLSRVASRINIQRQKGYSPNIEDAMKKPVNEMGFKKPMLAQPFNKVKNVSLKGAFIQPKYDGNRCIITMQDEKLTAYSRNGKEIAADLTHIFEGLKLEEGDYIDGELYAHGYALQTIVSWIKRNQSKTKLLRLHAYDMITPFNYKDRFQELHDKVSGPSIEVAPTFKINDVGDVWEAHDQFANDGYEGAIIRLNNCGYEDGKRSKSLIKVKKFLDDIFRILDIHPSKDGWARLECILPSGNTFLVSSPGDMEFKKKVYDERHMYIGRSVRVEFMNYTKDGIPFHPIATNFEG